MSRSFAATTPAPPAAEPVEQELSIWWAPIEGTEQEAFLDDDTQDGNLLFTGGWFAGKTMTLTAKVLKLSAINWPLPGIWLVPHWDHVEETIIPMLTSVDPDSGVHWFLRPDQFHYHQTKHHLSWEGGGEIWFFTAENPGGIAGPSVAWLAVDEPGSIKHEAWRNGAARVRAPGAKLRQKVASGTWEGLNWLADQFGDPARPDKYKVFEMKTKENTEGLKHAPDFINQVMDNITEAEAASYLDAKVSNLTGVLAFPPFEEKLHWSENVPELDPALPLRLTFDFNVNPMTLGLCQIVSGPYGPELHVRDWIAQYGGATVESCCMLLMERYPQGWNHVVVYGDATGKARHVKSNKSNYQIIRETLGTWAKKIEEKVPAANPSVKESTNAVNRLLKDAHGRTRLWIRKTEPRRQCPTRELVKSFQRTSKKSGTDEIEKKAGETHTHASEAIRYIVAVEFPVVKPIVNVGRARVERLL
jgi:hypothetical protein